MLRHLIVCREYPPAPYPPGGIGTYAKHVSRLLAEAGETVHVVAQRWEGAPEDVSESLGGRLIIHRVSLEEPLDTGARHAGTGGRLLRGLAASDCPAQLFAWQAARAVERLAGDGEIDTVEGQEWEAPLYFLQLRRALGLGPSRQPPVLVHLHSPSCLIFRHNEWGAGFRDFAPLSRMEAYTIRAADGVICPSRYLAREAESLFGLRAGSVQVIPYPLGETSVIERTAETWARQAIAYVGRLELRKGILEWVDAAVQVALSNSEVVFEFYGSDTSFDGGRDSSVLENLKPRIPRSVQPRFRFYRSQTREKLLARLARVAVVAVPSRWDNLPFTCIEAMSTGLPVLVSPNGGMVELIRDGKSGWIASGATPSGLAAAIRRVLETPAPERAAMGSEAARAVREICGNRPVIERHLALHCRLAAQGTGKSRFVPADEPAPAEPPRILEPSGAGSRGMGLVIVCKGRIDLLPGCLDSIRRQTRGPAKAVIVLDELQRHAAGKLVCGPLEDRGIVLVVAPSERLTRMAGAEALLEDAPGLGGVVFLDETVRLKPEFLECCEHLFECQPNVDVVTAWIARNAPEPTVDATPIEISAVDILNRGAACCAAVRAESVAEQMRPRELPTDEIRRPGVAVTYPAVLISVCAPPDPAAGSARAPYSAMVSSQSASGRLSLGSFLAAPLKEKARWLRGGIADPRRASQWLAWQLRRTAAQGR